MRIEEQILLETPDFVVVNKPSGLLTIPDRHDGELQSLRGILQKRYGEIFVVHRLDKDTSGVILFARNAEAHRYFSQLFESRGVRKFYQGLVTGQVVPSKGSILEPIIEHPAIKGKMATARKGKASHTDYEVLEDFGAYSLVQVQIHTGRTHQVRVHMKHIGNPIVMDELYGKAKPVLLSDIKKKYRLGKFTEEERPLLARLALHAFRLEFEDATGQAYTIEAPLPKDIQAVVTQLRKHV
ncbi:23S rRNA pseudouridine955/2504/2580 synthase/23S rRNA pseudouridine1911/1915/1917 synthase [Chitinophaga costaii]|uniref:23S rRNA pseudouridine955/2504/2580 synthase/23S rRNA pseudouridine1911/1915/1917 synthase n=1 Tax=Chitinophaga costaii TaxID=1335309 RepID=A0A1C4F9I0_9BACT|nr:RluA family pseudouridine synthase [Chitinophaga costaii]PUZ21169.1 RluA family pseudouridine synthase [Chitinophaga costaii]SCC52512.1 23S rRNA pseudouridine955/2504/2580 synthase/23S rRNA pseudouridine1911/1915/1917 synthase [Chitinophaga costaii]